MSLQKVFSWLVSQIPGIIIGFLGLMVTGAVNEIFTKRAEDRKAKKELLEEFGNILIEAEENMWKDLPIREKDFIKYCRKLSRYNMKLSDNLMLNYYVLWGGVSSNWIKPRKKWTKDEREMHDGSIGVLRALNIEFLNYSYPDRILHRRLKRISWFITTKKFYLFGKSRNKEVTKLAEQIGKITRKMLSDPF